ncbi:MAG: hypothetical protein KME05_10985 [Gloeocapsa sp. UFS-A4-WI-NPMV-4B04]|nr:hypothetical protein [Gloeocapsa sp. UFS-A4-WI-NPMV-4B04]
MPPFILILLLLVTGTWVTEVFVLTPLEFLRAFSLPNWLSWAAIALVLCWCFGE